MVLPSRKYLSSGKDTKNAPQKIRGAGESWTDRNLLFVCEGKIFETAAVYDSAYRHVMVVGTSAVPGDTDSLVSVQRRIQARPPFSGNIRRNAAFRKKDGITISQTKGKCQ